jgi:hypothetical protein
MTNEVLKISRKAPQKYIFFGVQIPSVVSFNFYEIVRTRVSG